MFWSAQSGHSKLSLSSKNRSKVQRRPKRRTLGVANDEIALHVLFTDSLGFLSVNDLDDVMREFSNTVFPEQIIENCLFRIMDIRSMYLILAGLVFHDESLSVVARALDFSHYSCRAVSLLYCNKVRIGFDSSDQAFSLCASITLHPHEILTWSVFVRGSYLNGKIDGSALLAGKGVA
jgi:hypothetical protein